MTRNFSPSGLILILLLLAPSCARIRGWVKGPTGTETRSSAPQAPERNSAAERDRLLTKAGELLDSGNHGAALENFRQIRDSFGPDDRTARAYLEAFEAVYRKAEAALGNGNCSVAGESYYHLNERFATLGALSAKLTFTAENLGSRLDKCRRMLSLKGLAQYRQGNIREAVTSWESLLRFDPGNEKIRNAVETATIQMEELRREGSRPSVITP